MSQVTSPYTIDINEGGCFGQRYTPIVLTLKTAFPITRRALRAVHKGVTGKSIRCSNQMYCIHRLEKGCLLRLKRFSWANEKSGSVTFCRISPKILESIIKPDGYKAVLKRGFSASAASCGLSKYMVFRTSEPYAPKGKQRERVTNWLKKFTQQPIKKESLERVLKADGYTLVKTQGISGAALISGLNRKVISKIIKQYPSKETFR
ncbi:MAG: hypothetical protein NWF05_11840 [Candidatus Bathyarchaeota archaeon]|nr:hypothetical protein [Candidatus Bathyarchaeota archaeon]